MVVLVAIVVYVDVVQPTSFRLAGRLTEVLGGSDRAASAVIVAIDLAALAAAFGWAAMLRARGVCASVVIAAVAAAPIWLLAIGVAPPTRDADESKQLISGWVGDDQLGARLDGALVVGFVASAAALGAGLLVRHLLVGEREEGIGSRFREY